MLQEQLDYPDMLVLVLPSLVSMVEHASDHDYANFIQPEFKRVFNMARPVQVDAGTHWRRVYGSPGVNLLSYQGKHIYTGADL